ncbi:hypothetical protein GCM10009559_15240 [Pseudonocardia zijingensis]|uniref:Uncharacterized protein n=2 Tax=Pseudonocardia zijingensis TaxID=153376 RepID=A0ABP3ZXX0_9PSEU
MRRRTFCGILAAMAEHGIDGSDVDAIRRCLDAAVGLTPIEALPHLREAADRLTELLDETMADAVLRGQATLRAAGARAGLTENAVGPRLARTRRLAAYADERGRVTAAALERARYDHESGAPRPAPKTTTMRFKPRRPT